MKKQILTVFSLLAPLALLAGCGKSGYDYTRHISEAREDIFRAETEEFSVTLSFGKREYPYADDGVACPLTPLAEISLVGKTGEDYAVYVAGEKEWGGEMSYRNVRGDYYYSESVDTFPEGSVTLRVEWGEERREIVATSVKTEHTLTPQEALGYAVAAEKESLERLTEQGAFMGEFRVRLLRRDATYYYVGIVDKNGRTISLLLDSETGEVLARRESK